MEKHIKRDANDTCIDLTGIESAKVDQEGSRELKSHLDGLKGHIRRFTESWAVRSAFFFDIGGGLKALAFLEESETIKLSTISFATIGSENEVLEYDREEEEEDCEEEPEELEKETQRRVVKEFDKDWFKAEVDTG